MRVGALMLLIALAAAGCHKAPPSKGPTTGDGIPLSDIDNSATNIDANHE